MLILTDTFSNKSSKEKYALNLYSDRIEIYNVHSDHVELKHLINAKDLAGSVVEESYASLDSSAYLLISSYPSICLDNKLKRRKLLLELVYSKHKDYSSNLRVVRNWNKSIQKIIDDKSSYDNKKPFLVYANPISGNGNACKLILNNVLKVWSESNVSYKIVLTGKFIYLFFWGYL